MQLRLLKICNKIYNSIEDRHTCLYTALYLYITDKVSSYILWADCDIVYKYNQYLTNIYIMWPIFMQLTVKLVPLAIHFYNASLMENTPNTVL